ncbi:MAG TPA: hypothetical protein VFP46_00495 [Candidatus Paceibacterota bacterium]|nr:hypothetical protein [Candidatus Paceibacterota bacterium]
MDNSEELAMYFVTKWIPLLGLYLIDRELAMLEDARNYRPSLVDRESLDTTEDIEELEGERYVAYRVTAATCVILGCLLTILARSHGQ